MENRQETSRQEPPRRRKFPVWADCYKDLLLPTYRKDEIILFFDTPPSPEERRNLVASFARDGIRVEEAKTRSCLTCSPDLPFKYIELWHGEGIHTVINTEGVRATTSSTTKTHGEQYSLNFLNHLPVDRLSGCKGPKAPGYDPGRDKNRLIVAVLDTGIDTALVGKHHLWVNPRPQDPACYPGSAYGWNFVANSPDVHDDNDGRHGSVVSQYIINEFAASPKNRVEIMSLKTHNAKGEGDLFGIICALHFALAKGARIINASWGFYYYNPFPNPYLQQLITETMRQRGVLFVTPAGNASDFHNRIANRINSNQNGQPLAPRDLRNLEIHNFYPAIFSSNDTNVVTVTTTDQRDVSPTQNYSEAFVDLGVVADRVAADSMRFLQPFSDGSAVQEDDFISGSSFATAIASGRLGAYCEAGAPLNKTALLAQLEGPVVFKSGALAPELIREGRFLGPSFKPKAPGKQTFKPSSV